MCSASQATTGINMQLRHLVTQSDNVFKESVSLHSEQKGMRLSQNDICHFFIVNVFTIQITFDFYRISMQQRLKLR